MANYKEIVTKAVIGKGKKYFKDNYSISAENEPTTILGCWVINHSFKGTKENDTVKIDGSYDINVWYSYDNNTKTDVIKMTNNYQEIVKVKKKEDVDLDKEEIIVRSLKQPTVIQADINGNNIVYTIEKELGIELVGNTKVKIVIDEKDDDEWDLIDDDNKLDSEVEQVIDNEVIENFL